MDIDDYPNRECDYEDTYHTDYTYSGQPKDVRFFMSKLFLDLPIVVEWLLSVRDCIVRLFGLKTGSFSDSIESMVQYEKNDKIILGMKDKHLDFIISISSVDISNNTQRVSVTTTVFYNNWLGKAYFFVVKPFHKMIVRYMVSKIK
jgi:Protein of unknown function (DUF2867).